MAGSPPRLLILATEDWFFVSHFLSVAVAAREAGFAVTVACRVRDEAKAAAIEAAGVRLVRSSHERGHFGLIAMARHVLAFRRLIRAERPTIVHLISLRLVVVAGLAARLAGVRARVLAVTGLGLVGARTDAKARAARALFGWLLRGPLGGKGARYLFENREDPVSLGLPVARADILVVGGAGVDPERFPVLPMPEGPLQVALIARMVRSKGIDLAVEAVSIARARGCPVTLTLCGLPDPENPASFTTAQLQTWAEGHGVRWLGQQADVVAIWRDHHVACVPSRGGEGLPRALLEGAACARPVLTTRTPGCATFVRDGVEGRLVAPDDAVALADALAAMAADPARLAAQGLAARARVLDGFTSAQVSAAIVALYRSMLPG